MVLNLAKGTQPQKTQGLGPEFDLIRVLKIIIYPPFSNNAPQIHLVLQQCYQWVKSSTKLLKLCLETKLQIYPAKEETLKKAIEVCR